MRVGDGKVVRWRLREETRLTFHPDWIVMDIMSAEISVTGADTAFSQISALSLSRTDMKKGIFTAKD